MCIIYSETTNYTYIYKLLKFGIFLLPILEKKRTEMSWMSLPLLNLFGRMGIRWGINQLNEDVKPIKNCKTSKSVTHHQPHEVESDGWIPVPSCGCRSQWLAVWCKLESPRGITTRWDGHICGHVSGESGGFWLHPSLQWDPPKSGGHMSAFWGFGQLHS